MLFESCFIKRDSLEYLIVGLSYFPVQNASEKKPFLPFILTIRNTVDMSPRNGVLPLEDVSIYYEFQGTGPLIFLISAAYGTCEPYSYLARTLSRHFTVVTFDRRGYFRSAKIDPNAKWSGKTLLADNANDTAALIKKFTEEPAFVFASSCGCMTAMELLRLYPSLVRKLVLHEPPPSRLLSEANYEEWRPIFRKVVEINRESGSMAAMQKFLPNVTSDREREVIRRTPEYSKLLSLSLITHGFFFDYELGAVIDYEAPLQIMDQYRDKIALLSSVDSTLPTIKEPIRALADKLRLPLNQTEGGHMAYLSHHKDFGRVLMQALGPVLEEGHSNEQMIKARL